MDRRREVPTTEDQSRDPISDYGRRKLAIEEYLLNELRGGMDFQRRCCIRATSSA